MPLFEWKQKYLATTYIIQPEKKNEVDQMSLSWSYSRSLRLSQADTRIFHFLSLITALLTDQP